MQLRTEETRKIIKGSRKVLDISKTEIEAFVKTKAVEQGFIGKLDINYVIGAKDITYPGDWGQPRVYEHYLERVEVREAEE